MALVKRNSDVTTNPMCPAVRRTPASSLVVGGGLLAGIALLAMLLAASLFLAPSAFAREKPKCDEGWNSTQKGICYRISNVRVNGVGDTAVLGEITSPRSYQLLVLGIVLYENGRPVCKGHATVANVEKGEPTAFEGSCPDEHPQPEKVVIRVDIAS